MKDDLSKSVQKIIQSIYISPIIVALLTLISFLFIVYNSIENFQTKYTGELKNNLIQREKEVTKRNLFEAVREIKYLKNQTNHRLQEKLKQRIYEANEIIKNIIKENKSKSKEEIKKLVSTALAPIRFFNKRGYYFVYDKDTKKSVIHPVKKFIGKDMSKFKDKKGQLLVKLYDKTIKQCGEGFATIYFVKPKSEDKKEYKKIVFVKYIPQLNWVIGTGDYFDEVEKKIQKELLNRLSQVRYAKNGYLWIINTDHILLMHPYRKDFIGEDETNLVDSKGTKIIQMFVNEAKKTDKGKFVEYFWKKPNSDKFYKKISYIKHIKDWNWVIGTGVYLDDLNELVKIEEEAYNKKISQLYKNIFIVFGFIMIITILLSIKLSKNIKKEFSTYSNALQETNDNLEHNVVQRTKELKELNNMLEIRVQEETEKNRLQEIQLFEQSKFAQMGEMIENIAHQWRQPLSVISTISSGIKFQYELGTFKKEDVIKDLGTLVRTTQHLSDTIDIFRDFIKEKRELKEVAVQDRLDKILEITDASLKNSHIRIIKEIDYNDPIRVKIVLGELSQVLINIINNSKDALNDKDIDDKWIKIACRKDGQKAIISIEDNAKGISDEIIDKVFDPYFTTKHQSQGTGIGLYMSKNIIEKHLGGKLYVENSSNGAKFYIEIPLES